jgi:hypothetical protein
VNPLYIVLGVAVLAYVLYRQLQKRSIREDRKPTLILVLAAIGVIELAQYLPQHPAGSTTIAMLVGSLVLGAVFGVIRAYTMRLWREGDTLYRQGNALTVVLWLVAIGAHFGLDYLIGRTGQGAEGLADTALMLYLAISLGAQRLVTNSRAARMVRAEPALR